MYVLYMFTWLDRCMDMGMEGWGMGGGRKGWREGGGRKEKEKDGYVCLSECMYTYIQFNINTVKAHGYLKGHL